MFPSTSMIYEFGDSGLADGIFLYHNGIESVREKMGFQPNYPSSFEKYTRIFLTRWVDSDKWVDGKRSKLKDLGLNLINPVTGENLEIDRYYYEDKVAIEIQGEQHFYPANLFSKENNDPIETFNILKEKDRIKKIQCEKQGIRLIEILFSDSDQDILNKLKGNLKLREKPLKIQDIDITNLETDTYHIYRNKEKAKKALLKIKEEIKEEPITSDTIREKNCSLYTAIKKFYGGIHGARNLINEPHPRKPKEYWTKEAVIKQIKQLHKKLNRFPTKKDLEKHETGLYYAVVKHGGIRNIKKELKL